MKTRPTIPAPVRAAALAVALLLTGTGFALAGPPAHAQKGGQPPNASDRFEPAPKGGKAKGPELGFSTRESTLIREWFAEPRNLEGLPPGLARRETLPPGLAKQVRRNGTLPPGLEKKLHPLPDGLIGILPPVRPGTRRVILGNDVLVLDERTSAVIDILSGVVRLGRTF